jgi:opacity protein-like surface antigen
MRRLKPLLILAAVLIITAPASAQVGVAAYFAFDLDALAAQKSFDAVLGTSNLKGFGGGVDVLNVWKGLFVRAVVTHARKQGNRAFVFNGEAIPLDVPITVSMTPVEIDGGWRFLTASRVMPYVGGGLLVIQYSEKSTFASSDENVSQTNRGVIAFGGVEVALSRWLMTGVEAQYRRVPNALGAAGVSQDFGETDLGGFTARVLLGITH